MTLLSSHWTAEVGSRPLLIERASATGRRACAPRRDSLGRPRNQLEDLWGCAGWPPAPCARVPDLPSPTPSKTDKMQTQTPQPNNPTPTAIPALYIVIPEESGIHPSGTITHKPAVLPIPGPLPSTELEAEVGAEAPTSASVLLSPSPLQALRERGIKGVRVPSPSLKQSKSCLKTQNNQTPAPPPCPAPRKIPGNPFRRHSIKTATSSINVQSTFNQNPQHPVASAPPLCYTPPRKLEV